MKRQLAALLASALPFLCPGSAAAFPHIVKPGETLAQIAARVYGNPRFETVLAGANALDAQGGSAIVPGMRLEIPAPGFHRVEAGETWYDLALTWLGDKNRADVLAHSVNGKNPWIPPVEGQEVAIPAVLTHIAGENETLTNVAERYLPDVKRAWELNNYNGRSGERLGRGEVLLVPLLHLSLTEAGKQEARGAAEAARAQGGGERLDVQRGVESELPLLTEDIHFGRYAEGAARGNRLLGTGVLTKPQLATVHRALLEAYVALEAPPLATAACAAWRKNDPSATKLDPVTISPKVRAACDAK